MTSKKPYIQIRTTEATIKKFAYIAEKDKRSMSNLGELIIDQYIQSYEEKNGKIDTETIDIPR